MKISRRGVELIRQHEGCRLAPYQCERGIWTIGHGMTFYPSGEKVQRFDEPLTLDQANNYFYEIVDRFAISVDKAIEVQVTQDEFDALVSLAYNIGMSNFKSSTLLKKVNENDKLAASMNFQSWSLIKGKRSLGLLRRRFDEARLFLGV